jgi:alpha-beta hydrolase superfamily lysophospholipase
MTADWAGLAPSFFSSDYWNGTLRPSRTLQFYLKRIDETVERVSNEFPGCTINIIAHSIGGWVGRAWLSEWASA